MSKKIKLSKKAKQVPTGEIEHGKILEGVAIHSETLEEYIIYEETLNPRITRIMLLKNFRQRKPLKKGEKNHLSDKAAKIKIGAYKHFKGNYYEVLCIALNEETPSQKEHVIYRALYGDQIIWARPLDNFLELKNVHGKSVVKFQKTPPLFQNKTTQ